MAKSVTSSITRRSIKIDGRITSVGLEADFWSAVDVIAESSGLSRGALIRQIDARRQHDNLSSAIRLFVLEYFRSRSPRPPE